MKETDVDGLEFEVSKAPEKGSGGGIPELSEGEVYEVVLAEVKKETINFGKGPTEVLRWYFELLDEEYVYEYDGQTRRRRVSGTSSALCNPKTKLYEWYCILMGCEPEVGEKIALSNIIGNGCRVMIKNTKGKKAKQDGTYPVYAKVDKVIKAKVPGKVDLDESVEEEVVEEKPKKVFKKEAPQKPVKRAPEPEVEEEEQDEVVAPKKTKVAPKPASKKAADEDDDDMFDDIFDEE